MTFFWISLGAVFGVNARFVITSWSVNRWTTTFPYGTLIVNVSGCFLMGAVVSLSANHVDHGQTARLLLTTGFLGAYTTFSTFAYETVALSRQRHHLAAVLNIVFNVAVGLLATGVGIWLFA